MKKLTLLTAILMTANLLVAQIINIPSDYPTIQLGIDAANEGDTVLVQTGTYFENLLIYREITLASLYVTTQDTSYISQTIIDGNAAGTVITIGVWNGWFYSGVDSTCVISGFTITNGYLAYGYDGGAGICCTNSNPILRDLIITDNHAYDGYWYSSKGGGIGIFDFCGSGLGPTLINVEISNNTAEEMGGGLFSWVHIQLDDVRFYNNSCTGTYGRGGAIACGRADFYNVIIKNCQSAMGGAVYCSSDTVLFNNVVISDNPGDALVLEDAGWPYNDLATLQNVVIENNAGYGIVSSFANLNLSGVRITHNSGGLKSMLGEVYFDTISRCSIYNNYGSYDAKEIDCSYPMDVVLDSFTVLVPTAFHVNQLSNCAFDILHGFFEQIDADVYVSPYGDNMSSGLSPCEPLKTIICAQTRLLNPHTIRLTEGTYSFELTGECFPVQLMDEIGMEGVFATDVILDGDGSTVLKLINNNFNKISGLSISNGEHGIVIENGYALIENVHIKNNYSQDDGGGIYMSSSSATFINNIIVENVAKRGGGIYCNNSQPLIINSTISNNEAVNTGGGIHCCNGSNATVINSILYENNPDQIMIQGVYTSNSATISYSNIQDGEDGVTISGTGTLNWFEGNIDENPLFEGSGDHPFQLSTGSPCIDAGTTDTTGLNLPLMDLLGNYRIWDGDGDGIERIDMGAYEFDAPIFVGIPQSEIANPKSEIQIFPNPFITHATIEFVLPQLAAVSIQIFNTMGTKVAELHHGQLPAGQQKFTWYAGHLPKGLYFCRVQAGEVTGTQKIIKVR